VFVPPTFPARSRFNDFISVAEIASNFEDMAVLVNLNSPSTKFISADLPRKSLTSIRIRLTTASSHAFSKPQHPVHSCERRNLVSLMLAQSDRGICGHLRGYWFPTLVFASKHMVGMHGYVGWMRALKRQVPMLLPWVL